VSLRKRLKAGLQLRSSGKLRTAYSLDSGRCGQVEYVSGPLRDEISLQIIDGPLAEHTLHVVLNLGEIVRQRYIVPLHFDDGQCRVVSVIRSRFHDDEVWLIQLLPPAPCNSGP
jgi:hypothetical protein